MNPISFENFSWKRILPFVVITVLYFAWYIFVEGLRPEHVYLFVLCIFLYLVHNNTRKFIMAFSVFVFYWIVYDSMRIFPNYDFNTVHIIQPYLAEKYLFGVKYHGELLTLNEYFNQIHGPFLDFLTGFFYINWVPIPLIFAFWLMVNNKRLFLKFSYAFLFTNLLGFVVYYIYPAAPPWYVAIYGFDLKLGTPGYAAGLLNFDKLMGIHLFENMYTKNSNVFAAIPSLHSSYPVLCFLYGYQLKKKWLNILFGVFTIGIWFSAIYTGHHYLIDVAAGFLIAIIGYISFEFLSERTKLKNWFDYLLERI